MYVLQPRCIEKGKRTAQWAGPHVSIEEIAGAAVLPKSIANKAGSCPAIRKELNTGAAKACQERLLFVFYILSIANVSH